MRDKGVGVKLPVFIKDLSVGYWLDWNGKIEWETPHENKSLRSLMIFSSLFYFILIVMSSHLTQWEFQLRIYSHMISFELFCLLQCFPYTFVK